MKFVYLFFFWALTTLALDQITQIKVLATVAGAVVTNRQVEVEEVLESPDKFKKVLQSEPLVDIAQSTQRLVFQLMVEEENKIFQSEKVSNAEIDESLKSLKTALGELGYKSFVRFYDLSERELRKKLERRILLNKALSSRMKYHASSGQIEEQTKVLEDWFVQLKGRYKVVFFD